MYFVKKKDLKIVGGVSAHVVQFQMNYSNTQTFIIKQEQKWQTEKKH